MASGANFFLNKTLGSDFLESLEKFELYKPGTRTVVDHEELRTALQIVPRTVLALLIKELTPMSIGDNKDIELQVEGGATLNVQKHERDVYSGKINQGSKIIVEFVNRSIPGIGLVVMSTFELYDVNQLSENMSNSSGNDHNMGDKVQKLVDERLALHDLIGKVIDKKIMQREAIDKLVLMKLTEAVDEQKAKDKLDKIVEITKISEDSTPKPIEYHRGMTNGLKVAESIATGNDAKFLEAPKGHQKLKDFIELRKKKNEFTVHMAKNDTANCPDCSKEIFNSTGFSGCICYGENMNDKVFIKKTENGIKLSFSPTWDPENIELLLEVLRNRKK